MGYSLLFAQGWTWGNLIGEGIAAFLFCFLLIFGKRFIGNLSQSGMTTRFLTAGLVFFAVLISSLTSLGISELYQRSSGAPILTPVFGIFYGFIIGTYDVAGMIIAAQLIGGLTGYVLGLLLRPQKKEKLGKSLPAASTKLRVFLAKAVLTSVLLCGAAVVSLINPTSYGGTAVLKLLIMSFIFFGAFLVFGNLEFYSYTSFYGFLGDHFKFTVKITASEPIVAPFRSGRRFFATG